MKKIITLLLVIVCACGAKAQIITTVAGGYDTLNIGDGGPAVDCELKFPYSTALDAVGNLYIADLGHNRVRMVNAATGIITTIAGTGRPAYGGDDSAATVGSLNDPSGVAVDSKGNVYIGDNFNHRIRKVDVAGIITTVAGTNSFGYNGDNISATAAKLYSPHEIAIDSHDNLYICDVLNNRIRKVDTAGIITTIAGNGGSGYVGDGNAATSGAIGEPYGVAIDASGNIFFADVTSNKVFKINTSGILSTIAGDGSGFGYNGDNIPATNAKLYQPFGVAVDAYSNVYFADSYNNRIREVSPSGIITTYAGEGTQGFSGDGGLAIDAELYGPVGVTLDGSGDLYIADWGNYKVRYIRSTVLAPIINSKIRCLRVYPNPCRDKINVFVSSDKNEEVLFTIVNVLGQEIGKYNVTTNVESFINLNLPAGAYYISTNFEEEYLVDKIIVY